MLIRHLADADKNRNVEGDGWDSSRLLLKKDGVGFSFHVTTLYEGVDNQFWYKNHYEAVYVLSGEGWIKDLGTGETHELKPGTLYVLNEHDRHIVHANKEMKVACVFNPPVSGKETHDEDGAYRLDAEEFPE